MAKGRKSVRPKYKAYKATHSQEIPRKPTTKYKNSFRKHAGVEFPGMLITKSDKLIPGFYKEVKQFD